MLLAVLSPSAAKAAPDLVRIVAAEAADAYPLLVVVPNVVKTNWAREAARRAGADDQHVGVGGGHKQPPAGA